ncbi:MAG: UDP-N-acetylmuramate:L-alanyl-gamma-D-glutamyl-meso-diaminopimelate ligase [Deltaproteobacteria bacterium]|nr:UDP-N-acetylmuramate:L-alanyl-gamma-D-glutamyl-meso-diaminopimelate ligase [Deltaproteobacteria bacterium]MBW2120552.1 UDP-N-acetylmuramate:L-alanyl-gamma-D-glutamyl-meso-diaminopimelate ligase [Deltaproteobacteria bacterium]
MKSQNHIHFIGICGTGMAAGAVLMKAKGYRVTGSDTGVYPPMSTYLEGEGIGFAIGFDPSNLVPRPDLVVIGNSLSRGNPEIEAVLDLKIPYVSLPELLRKELIRAKRSLVVTGTHGKTTSSSLLAWVLESSGRSPSFFVGGIPLNFARPIRRTEGSEVVLEGDEYDTCFFDKRPKFLHYRPDVMIITNIEFDHADIYRNIHEIETVFASAQQLIPRKGLVVANGDESAVRRALKRTFCPVEWFGLGENVTWRIAEFRPEGEGIAFSLLHKGRLNSRLYLPVMGEHNALNAAAVYIVCHRLGLTSQEIQRGFGTFKGVRRRMEKRGTFRGVTVFDDFAHHPTAIARTISALKAHYPGRPLWAVFEPRTNTTRRNLFQRELAEAFRGARGVLIGEVYRKDRIDPVHRLDPARLARDIEVNLTQRAWYMPEVDEIVAFLSDSVRQGELVVVMSNGGFGGLTDKLVSTLKQQDHRGDIH